MVVASTIIMYAGVPETNLAIKAASDVNSVMVKVFCQLWNSAHSIRYIQFDYPCRGWNFGKQGTTFFSKQEINLEAKLDKTACKLNENCLRATYFEVIEIQGNAAAFLFYLILCFHSVLLV
jgi:hypothetical protein